ncbi:MAG: hypothetical protein ACKOEQ_02945 [Verrucomicrobiota bacterium]
MQLVGKDGLLVGAAVAVGVLEDEDLVVGPGFAGLVMGIGRGDGDPEAALVVE